MKRVSRKPRCWAPPAPRNRECDAARRLLQDSAPILSVLLCGCLRSSGLLAGVTHESVAERFTNPAEDHHPAIIGGPRQRRWYSDSSSRGGVGKSGQPLLAFP